MKRFRLGPDGRVVSFEVPAAMPGAPAPVPVPVPADKWPTWALGAALLRKPEDRGVGDTVERWARKVGGAQFKAMSKAVGLPCRCAERREEWNAAYPYS